MGKPWSEQSTEERVRSAKSHYEKYLAKVPEFKEVSYTSEYWYGYGGAVEAFICCLDAILAESLPWEKINAKKGDITP